MPGVLPNGLLIGATPHDLPDPGFLDALAPPTREVATVGPELLRSAGQL